jgi:hypothetical protein
VLHGLAGFAWCAEGRALTSTKRSLPSASEVFLLSPWLAESQRCPNRAPDSDMGVSCTHTGFMGTEVRAAAH